jgi:hypothetical protein
MKFFKPEDFEYNYAGLKDWMVYAKRIADCANDKLEREGKRVYSHESRPGWSGWYEDKSTLLEATYQAYVISIEPIKKCEHPKHKVSLTFSIEYDEIYTCSCGARVQPSSFVEEK